MVLKRFLISPPFGNWIGNRHCVRVLGSFTWESRPGLIYHTLRSLRHIPGGWRNQIGLRNSGIRSIRFDPRHIYSLVGLEDGDWERMLAHCPPNIIIEINLGCPNIHRYGISYQVLLHYCRKFRIIAKLPPTDDVDDIAAMCIEAGVDYLHCCNTLPTLHGGESGLRLFQVNLPIVERLAARYPGKIIAGGGIYNQQNLTRYEQAGATHFSLSTVWFTPWQVPAIMRTETRSSADSSGTP